jgi:hypothetical protein
MLVLGMTPFLNERSAAAWCWSAAGSGGIVGPAARHRAERHTFSAPRPGEEDRNFVAGAIISAKLMLILDKAHKIGESPLIMKKVSILITSSYLMISPILAQDAEKGAESPLIEQAPAGAVVDVPPLPVETEMPSTLTTVKGKTFTRVEVLKYDPDGLMFRHALGMAKVPFADLPVEIQKRFQYKPEAAAALVKEHVDAEREARAKAEAARAEARERKVMEKAMRLQMELMRQQAAIGAMDGGLVIPGFADFGVPTLGYGGEFGLGFLPELGRGKGKGKGPSLTELAQRKYQWDRDVLFGDFSTRKYIGPNAALYNGSVTNSNVRPFATFGGYQYPTELAVLTGNASNHRSYGRHMGSRSTMAPGQRPMARPMAGPAAQRFVPANSGGARIGGTGTLMQGSSNRISHR